MERILLRVLVVNIPMVVAAVTAYVGLRLFKKVELGVIDDE